MASKELPSARSDWAYFLDVDGTLIDIAEAPDAVVVDDALLGLVARLHRACGGALALISGRSLAGLDDLLGSIRVPLAGQHGAERRDAAGVLRSQPVRTEALAAIRERLAAVVARHPGLLLEDKGRTLALHYRQAPRLAPYVHRLMGELARPAPGRLCLQKGKRVVEVKPCGFDKGSAIAAFMAEPPFRGRRPVFIGDDVTDEYGFAVVNRLDGLSIKVGPGRSEARWRLPDVAAVRAWLAAAVAADKARGE